MSKNSKIPWLSDKYGLPKLSRVVSIAPTEGKIEFFQNERESISSVSDDDKPKISDQKTKN